MRRRGHGLALLLASVALVGGCIAVLLLLQSRAGGAPTGRLLVYCAAGLQKPVSELAEEYRRESGIEVQLQYGGTGTLLCTIAVVRVGDCFLTADESTVGLARQQGLVAATLPLARQHPVIGVPAGNPLRISGLADLVRPGLRLGLANPDAAAISKLARSVLTPLGRWQPLLDAARVLKPTVKDIANDIRLGAIDAAIVWDVTVVEYAGALSAVEMPEFSGISEQAMAVVLTVGSQPTAALSFARFCATPEHGGLIFARHGYARASAVPASTPSPPAPPPGGQDAAHGR